MIPSRFEYFFLLSIIALAGWSLLGHQLQPVIKRASYWVSFVIFFGACTIIDLLAINLGWWWFSNEKTVGLLIGSIPVEEFILFILFFNLTVAAWESLKP